MAERHESQASDGRSGVRLPTAPVALLAITLFALLAFQTIQLVREHGALTELRAAQETTVLESLRLRNQLETLAGKTAQLADEGDAAAKTIVEEMRRQGVNMTAPKQ